MEALITGKGIAIIVFIKKLEWSHTSNLSAHLKALEQKEVNIFKRSKWQETVKFSADVNQLGNKVNNTKNQQKQEAGSLRKSTR